METDKYPKVKTPNKDRLKRRAIEPKRPEYGPDIHELEALARAHHQFRLKGIRVPLDNDHSLDKFLCITKPQKGEEPEVGKPTKVLDWKKETVEINLTSGEVVTLSKTEYWVIVKHLLCSKDRDLISKFGGGELVENKRWELIWSEFF